jgi:hypothetical protein
MAWDLLEYLASFKKAACQSNQSVGLKLSFSFHSVPKELDKPVLKFPYHNCSIE